MTKNIINNNSADEIQHDGLAECDDCAICRAMAMADKRGYELSEKELLDVFAEQNAENAKNTKMPETIITYRCEGCGETVMTSDDQEDEAECFACGTGDFLKELKREPITPELIAVGMKKSAESIVTNLQKAYEAGKTAGFEKDEEEEMLQALAKAKEMRDSVLNIVEEINLER
ncbi:MAG: hypothetical protein Q7S57_01340 [bacterium]|nr:hypothetical protein [bacterium]